MVRSASVFRKINKSAPRRRVAAKKPAPPPRYGKKPAPALRDGRKRYSVVIQPALTIASIIESTSLLLILPSPLKSAAAATKPAGAFPTR